jgi:hypothetical protein
MVLAGEFPIPTIIPATAAIVTIASRPARLIRARWARPRARRHLALMLVSSVAINPKPGALCTLAAFEAIYPLLVGP